MESTHQQPAQQSVPGKQTATKKQGPRLRLGYVLLFIIILALAGTSFAFYKKYNDLKKDPQVVASRETQTVVASVARHLQLPSDESPTIATVEDKSKLKDQPFFASVENGDKILIYTKNRKAIVYRPGSDKVVNVGPIAINSQNTTPQGTH